MADDKTTRCLKAAFGYALTEHPERLAAIMTLGQAIDYAAWEVVRDEIALLTARDSARKDGLIE